ncbi:MAG: type II 3-dehydroquinate dehydratase [Flavobacteriaceae bacterium]|jgi:3-dehydroquinate dehydratase-2|nr:type II 3-dehydroquinate dehydratase [Flavobacteriaceae bacterium]MBT4297843.1 type II 3-dehydroquinate dehydratase [Flavobacteriaceae bacterium]MBT4960626.1 type II 3-dehydroquinate dehydratase [Flavobacteriaceae bacterium]MBT5233081.1 type II 3-dehydroquinate dehydratase [Flavobacteriaceae bacterium]MBT5493306.1 type II 3-dehydroquinate dehydratase [Flavobacteriaceae bacterium]|tara:strand:+ start:1237 stop:1653 length:417 start_codon:yes stop_codon:yes gene_type:complete
MKLQIINGPNLNLLGKREKNIYGDQSFEDYFKKLKIKFNNLELHYFQSNIEGELIEKIQEVGFNFDGIIINAAAYTHTSVGIGDAIRSVSSPVIEVHISNTYSREEFRHKSFLSAHVKGVILGFGLKSYDLAIESFNK